MLNITKEQFEEGCTEVEALLDQLEDSPLLNSPRANAIMERYMAIYMEHPVVVKLMDKYQDQLVAKLVKALKETDKPKASVHMNVNEDESKDAAA